MLFLEMIVIFLLVVVNGALAMSEVAMISARKGRLRHMRDQGDRGAAAALELITEPSRFFATVQIGMTSIGILAGAFGGATLADRLGTWLNDFIAIAPNGDIIAIGIVVASITYVSLIFGELLPKRLALVNPEWFALRFAVPIRRLAQVTAPAVWLLQISIEPFVRALGLGKVRGTVITEDEVKYLIAEGTRAGIFVPKEREMIEAVLRLADRSVRVIMTPRSDIGWIDLHADQSEIARAFKTTHFSRLLVCDGSPDEVVGVIHAKDLLPVALTGNPVSLASLMLPAPIVPDRTQALTLLERFRRSGVHMAAIVDEYGSTEGVVTLTDVLESIAGELPERGEPAEPLIVQRADGSWLVDGTLPIDEFEDRSGFKGLQAEHDFHTMAGFVLQELERIPVTGECFDRHGLRFEIVDMDGRRIDQLLIRRQQHTDQPAKTNEPTATPDDQAPRSGRDSNNGPTS